MAISTQIIQDILDKASSQYKILEDAINEINADSPEYFPIVTSSDDYDFESFMLPSLSQDVWTTGSLIKSTPLSRALSGLMRYFSSSSNFWDITHEQSLDQYLYSNNMTATRYFADALFYSVGHKMAGILVENVDPFTFAELGKNSEGTSYFTSIASYQTDQINLPYGIYSSYVGFAPTDKVEVELVNVTGTINFDIALICKDGNGDTFILNQNLSGITGDKIALELTEKVTGFSGVSLTPYNGTAGDLLRIQTALEE